MGKLIALILLGFWNFISIYKPFDNSFDRFKSSKVLADVYGVSFTVTYIKINPLIYQNPKLKTEQNISIRLNNTRVFLHSCSK